MSDVLSLSTYKSIVRETSTDYDTQLGLLISAANSFVEKYCNRQFGEGEYTERHKGLLDALGRFVFKVDNLPIIDTPISVTLNYYGVESPFEIDVTKLDVFNNSGLAYYARALSPEINVIRPEYQKNFYYDIVYSGGGTVPGDVTLAAAYIVQASHKYMESFADVASGTGTGFMTELSIGDYTEKYDSSLFKELHKDGGLVVSQTVKSILDKYKRLGVHIA